MEFFCNGVCITVLNQAARPLQIGFPNPKPNFGLKLSFPFREGWSARPPISSQCNGGLQMPQGSTSPSLSLTQTRGSNGFSFFFFFFFVEFNFIRKIRDLVAPLCGSDPKNLRRSVRLWCKCLQNVYTLWLVIELKVWWSVFILPDNWMNYGVVKLRIWFSGFCYSVAFGKILKSFELYVRMPSRSSLVSCFSSAFWFLLLRVC